jgi:hypothetical protein
MSPIMPCSLLGTTRQRLLSRGRQYTGESGFGSFGSGNTRGVYRMSLWHSLSMKEELDGCSARLWLGILLFCDLVHFVRWMNL